MEFGFFEDYAYKCTYFPQTCQSFPKHFQQGLGALPQFCGVAAAAAWHFVS
jgi:hypothetical protein